MRTEQRIFVPGSEWVYIKIYTGSKSSDKILANDIYSIIKKLERSQYLKKWFFIRYADPDFHLRIRILVKNKMYIGEIIDSFFKQLTPLVEGNVIWKIQLDTYNRELERYGNNLMQLAESIFYLDSECILNIVRKLNQSKNENHRWMIGLKMIDAFLSDFLFDIQSKRQIMENLSSSLKIEFGFNKHNSKQFNTKFRENKITIESVLNNTIQDVDFTSMYLPIEMKSKKMLPIIEELKLNIKKQKIDITIDNLLGSYIHMMLNRLFRSKNRTHELVLYDFMLRYYNSEVAKNKYNIN